MWFRWYSYFRGEAVESLWHYANAWNDERTFCGRKFNGALAETREDPKRKRCTRCVERLGRTARGV